MTVTMTPNRRVVTARSTLVKGWAQHGICGKAEPDALFARGAAQQAAKQICKECPVILECLADSLDNHTEFGVWGGMTERQRRALLRRQPEVTSWRKLLEARSSSTRTGLDTARSGEGGRAGVPRPAAGVPGT